MLTEISQNRDSRRLSNAEKREISGMLDKMYREACQNYSYSILLRAEELQLPDAVLNAMIVALDQSTNSLFSQANSKNRGEKIALILQVARNHPDFLTEIDENLQLIQAVLTDRN